MYVCDNIGQGVDTYKHLIALRCKQQYRIIVRTNEKAYILIGGLVIIFIICTLLVRFTADHRDLINGKLELPAFQSLLQLYKKKISWNDIFFSP